MGGPVVEIVEDAGGGGLVRDSHRYLRERRGNVLHKRCLHESAEVTAGVDTTFVFRHCQRSSSVETLDDEGTLIPRPRRREGGKLIDGMCVRGRRSLIGAD